MNKTKAAQKRDIEMIIDYQTNPGTSLGIDLQNAPRSHFLLRNLNFEGVGQVVGASAPVDMVQDQAARGRGVINAAAVVPQPPIAEHERPRIEFINVERRQEDRSLVQRMYLKEVIQYIPAPVQPYRPARNIPADDQVHFAAKPPELPVYQSNRKSDF